jgi:putative aminopeptidase FrvX
MDFQLLKTMCAIHAPSGNEAAMTDFLLDYIKSNKKNWKRQPRIYSGEDFQDCIVLVFGKPRTAVFAHIDSIGFTVRYKKGLVKIGGPRTKSDYVLVGKDQSGDIACKLIAKKNRSTGEVQLSYTGARTFDRGTTLTFKPKWRENENFVQCCYMDNRLGIFNALKLAETLENGVICFTCYEEHGGGTVAYLQRFLQQKYNVKQALISDITWVTEGVRPGKGVALSLRDSLIPRKKFTDKIVALATTSGIPFQLEVEGSGGSDAKELQQAEYLWDWMFVGAPEDKVHTPDEKVHKKDIEAMIDMYKYLMNKL